MRWMEPEQASLRVNRRVEMHQDSSNEIYLVLILRSLLQLENFRVVVESLKNLVSGETHHVKRICTHGITFN